jgi:hypothetical protein
MATVLPISGREPETRLDGGTGRVLVVIGNGGARFDAPIVTG